jgi:hypothetical protein
MFEFVPVTEKEFNTPCVDYKKAMRSKSGTLLYPTLYGSLIFTTVFWKRTLDG